MNPIGLKDQYGDRYRIGHDEVAEGKEAGSDPWLYIVPGKYGHVYPHSDQLLAVQLCDTPKMRGRLGRVAGLIHHQIGNVEAVYLFAPDRFDQVAETIKLHRRRGVSDKQFEALTERGRGTRFSAKNTASNTNRRSTSAFSRPSPTRRATPIRNGVLGAVS